MIRVMIPGVEPFETEPLKTSQLGEAKITYEGQERWIPAHWWKDTSS